MWLDPVETEDGIRQGDLLVGVPFAEHKGDATDGLFTRAVTTHAGIAVSHCCVIENSHQVSLAKVELRKLPSKWLHRFQALTPSDLDASEQASFPFREFLLEPPSSLREPDAGFFYVARLVTTEDFTAPLDWLVGKRRARMTVKSRMSLRLKLAFLYGRAEAEDEAALLAMGVQPFMERVA